MKAIVGIVLLTAVLFGACATQKTAVSTSIEKKGYEKVTIEPTRKNPATLVQHFFDGVLFLTESFNASGQLSGLEVANESLFPDRYFQGDQPVAAGQALYSLFCGNCHRTTTRVQTNITREFGGAVQKFAGWLKSSDHGRLSVVHKKVLNPFEVEALTAYILKK